MSDNSAPSSETVEQAMTSGSSNNTTLIDPQSPLRPLINDVMANGHVAQDGLLSKKNHKKDILKRYYNDHHPKKFHHIKAFQQTQSVVTNNFPTEAPPAESNENIQPARASPSRSPHFGDSTSSSLSATPAAPRLTLIDFLSAENNDNSQEGLNNRPPSSNSDVSTNSDSSHASTIPLDSNKRSLHQSFENISESLNTVNKRKKKNTDESTQSQNSTPGRSSPENDSSSNASSGSNASTVPLPRLRVPTKAELKQGPSTSGAGEINFAVHSPENGSQIGGNTTEGQGEVNHKPGPSTPIKTPTATTRKAAGGIKKKRRKYRRVHYYRPVGQLNKKININEIIQTSITLRSLEIMDNFMKDMFERLACEAGNLLKISGRKTLTARDFEFATRLVLPPKLAEGARWRAIRALEQYAREPKRNSA